MKRWILVFISAIIVIPLVLTGCGESEPDPSEIVTLRYGNQNPEMGWDAVNAANPMLEKITKATGGKVKFETYFGSTLYAPPDAWEAVKTGIADVAWTWAGFKPDITSLADVIALPFMPFKSAKQASGILWKLYEKFPAIAEQYNKENKILFLWASTPYFLVTTDKQVKTLEDLQGMIIRVGGGPPTDQITMLGAVPTGVGMGGTYEALQKGVIDGMGMPAEAFYSFRQYEVAPYITYVDLHTVYFAYAMNWNTWNSLSKDVQEDIMSVGGLEAAEFYGENMFDTALGAALDAAAEGGYTMYEYTLPDDEVARWTEIAGEPLWEQWVADREAEGYSEARDILDTCLKLIESYNP
ncbi:MAG: TRAP transporter substrate-binding protein [Dehalococcoidales bacterium]|nr:TRAP transporter substrate-binding protein [Dehalococcoidales bacterium]